MADVKWIKIVTDIFDNRKIRQIETLPDGDAIIVIWVKLLCLAGSINDEGKIYITEEIPYNDQTLAAQFSRPISTVRLAIDTFEKFGMINVIDNMLHISNWERYQNIEGMERIREQNRIRKQNQRKRESTKLLEVNDMSRDVSRDVAQQIRIDKSREDKIIRESKERKDTKVSSKTTQVKNVIPPTKEMVEQYISDKGYSIEADRFIDYYEANGWKVGKNKMKDWQATLRGWASRDKESKNAKDISTSKDSYGYAGKEEDFNKYLSK